MTWRRLWRKCLEWIYENGLRKHEQTTLNGVWTSCYRGTHSDRAVRIDIRNAIE